MPSRPDLGETAEGVVLATFAADALGARWEGSPAVEAGEARRRLDVSLEAGVLRYTDDTQLTMALAEHLCDHPAVDPPRLADTFLQHFERHRGYARGMFGIVDAWQRGLAVEEAATSVFPEGSFGNGGAMRVAPVAVVWGESEHDLRQAAERQARITHAHAVGVDAAVTQARAVALAAEHGTFGSDGVDVLVDAATTQAMRSTLLSARRCLSSPGLPLAEVAASVGTGVLADQSVAAAIWVAAVADDLTEAVTLALGLGGDADTIAAMSGAIVGAAQGRDAVPQRWVEKLEDGARGRRYAVALAQRLAETAQRVRRSASARTSTAAERAEGSGPP